MFSDVVNRLRLCRGLRLISRGRHRIENVAVDIERLGLRALRLNLGRCSQHRKDKAQDHIVLHREFSISIAAGFLIAPGRNRESDFIE